MTKAECERLLQSWETNDCDLEDVVHAYFDECGVESWVDAADEGRKVWSLMFDTPVEEESPIHAVLLGVAAAASYSAFNAAERALGLPLNSLHLEVEKANAKESQA